MAEKKGYRGLLLSDKLDFEPDTPAKVQQLCRDCCGISGAYMEPYYEQSRRFRDLYYVHLDLANLNPMQVHVRLGKIHSLIEMYAAQSVGALFSSTPYMPLYPENPLWAKNAELMTKALDIQSRQHKWFPRLAKGMKMCHLDGTSFLTAEWQMEPRRETRKGINRIGKWMGGESKVEDQWVDEGLRIREIPFWACYWDPMKESTGEMRWFIEKYPCSRTEVLRMIKAEMFEIDGKATKVEDIKQLSSYRDSSQSLGNVLLSELDSRGKGLDDDACVLVIMYCPLTLTKYILLDGETLIHKQTSGSSREYFVPYAALINSQDPVSNRLMGISDVMGVEQLAYYIDDSLSIALRADRQRLDQVLLYNRDAFPNFNILNTVAGARIPITSDMLLKVGGDWEQLVHQLAPHPQSADSYRIREELVNHYNETVGRGQTAQGSETQGDPTAYEIRKMLEQTEKRFAVKMALAEQVGLEVLAQHAYKINGENMTEEMRQRYFGKDAKKFLRKTPSDLPGGALVRLRGSALLGGEEAKKNERLAQIQAGAGFLPPEMLMMMMEQTMKDSNAWDSQFMEKAADLLKPQPQPEQLPGMSPVAKPPIVGNLVPMGASTVTAGTAGMAA